MRNACVGVRVTLNILRETLRALLLRKAACLFLIYWKFPLNEQRSE